MDENQKFRCVLNIQFEIHPLEKTGECSGKIIPESKINEYGLKSKKLYKLDGENLHFVLLELKQILEKLQ